MTETLTLRDWTMRCILVAICCAVFMVKLLPFGPSIQNWPGPDWIVAVVLAWTIRRSEYAPVLLVGGALLLADLLFHRPPGLWAVIIVLACEGLRSQSEELKDVPFPVEWATVAGVLILASLANRAVYAVFLIDQVPLLIAFVEVALTVVIYPAIVLLSYLLFDIRKAAPGEVDERGRRR